MNPKIQTLLDQVNQVYPGQVITRVGQEHDGRLHLDRVSQSTLAGRILIELADSTAADFLLGNELLKMLLTLNGAIPQIFFAVTFDNEQLDNQLIQIATRMHRVVVHTITYPELNQHGIITVETVSEYLAGVHEELSPETEQQDPETLWRLLVLMDALVFGHTLNDNQAFFDDLKANYPRAFAAAQAIVRPFWSVDFKQPRQTRKQMVRVFDAVDKALYNWQLPTVNAREYVTLTSVLSKRQLSLPVRQVFDIFHTEMLDFQTKETAYVGLNKGDQQNSFVITPPQNEADRPAFFQQLYALPVQDLFKQLALPYIERG
ncbi:nitrate ABC transporter ATPase [Convivina intestini]|uniref:IpaB/EvcA family protein n=1 Tax=Convivina intestini TaxID=1505726 RepID=A0A2U1DBC3_9LACO|nr:nitrate ABC transporter ATPase [Convivina intestini]PVY84993.1 hypothetical protein C7384_10311 [Convivina intestini]CAH1853339.1 hypothetical protein R077811_00665 [Convivina intestini]SDB89547.1 hypothetical protein SAMN05216341_103143 [Leuconostocaceae bacterium R-53105]